MRRREFLASGLAIAAAQDRRPNIVWIMADDLGYADLGCYGQKHIRTPNIDRLAREGMRFTDAYAGCAVCAPSRSVLMTGKHMGHTSVRSNPGGVPLLREDVTAAEVLKEAGYFTGGFGKWGLGDVGTTGAPPRQGWDEFFGYLHQVHAHYYYPEYLIDGEQRWPLAGNERGKRTAYSHDVIAERGLEFIRRNRGRPFFCYLPFTIPHLELLVPEDSLAPYRGKIPEAGPWVDPRRHYADQPYPRACYAGMVSRLDRDVGRVLVLLRELGIEENTVMFFTSDNGAAMPLWKESFFGSTGGLRGHKQNLYEGGIRVPMIARWPGRIRAGAVSRLAWSFVDFLPTAAELAEARPPGGLDGVSVVSALLGEERRQKRHQFLYWELPRYDGKTGEFRRETPMQALRMGRWKAVRPQPDGALELYDLEKDIGETRNVAREEPEVMRKIEEYLKTARTEPRPQKGPRWEQGR